MRPYQLTRFEDCTASTEHEVATTGLIVTTSSFAKDANLFQDQDNYCILTRRPSSIANTAQRPHNKRCPVHEIWRRRLSGGPIWLAALIHCTESFLLDVNPVTNPIERLLAQSNRVIACADCAQIDSGSERRLACCYCCLRFRAVYDPVLVVIKLIWYLPGSLPKGRITRRFSRRAGSTGISPRGVFWSPRALELSRRLRVAASNALATIDPDAFGFPRYSYPRNPASANTTVVPPISFRVRARLPARRLSSLTARYSA